MKYKIITLLLVCFSLPGFALEVFLKDIASIEGIRENHLSGYGIVVGLGGTGDTKSNVTSESMKNYLKNLGVSSAGKNAQYRNIASVLVTASIPSYGKAGDRVDVTISSIGDAKSLEGGVLLQTPLKSINGETYAVASGNIAIGGKDSGERSSLSRKQKNTVGIINRGGIIEKELKSDFFQQKIFRIRLKDQDFGTLNQLKERFDSNFQVKSKAVSPSELEIEIPESRKENPLAFLADLEKIKVKTSSKARVVINERTGVIVMGGNIGLEEVAIARQGMNIKVQKSPYPLYLGEDEKKEKKPEIQKIEEATTVSDVVDALNKLGLSTKDIIAILEALKTAGALHAEVMIQ